MRKSILFVVILQLLLVSGLIYAQTAIQEKPDWPPNLPLPAFKLPNEKGNTGQTTLDDVTPPPTEPVRMVAEFELQEGVQVAYPGWWGGTINTFIEIVRECQEVGVVYIVVPGLPEMSTCSGLLQAAGVPLDNIEYQIHPMEAIWSRDYGAHFVWGQSSDEIALVDWQYYDDRPNDDEIPDFQAGLWHMNFYETPIYHEGGNIMSDGHGTVMCSNVLWENNPTWSHADLAQELGEYYGATNVQIYQRIPLLWDATGHIDLWGKILNDTTIMVAQLQPDDPNFSMIEQHAARMAQVPTVYGTPFHVVRCPMPAPYWFYAWYYYKSFLNSLIFNGKVLVPIYATEPVLTPQALAAYQAAMPDYEVVGIYSDDIAPAGGAIHCTTIGIADHLQDYVHNAEVTATPSSPPIVIPPAGGSFQYIASVHNNEADSIYTEVWAEARLPNGSNYGPLWLRSVPLAANGTASRTMSQAVPGNAPAGNYQYLLYTGSHLPRVINDSSYFAFTKSGVAGGLSADLTGWSADELTLTRFSENLNQPEQSALLNAYPNPFNPRTELRYTLPQDGNYNLTVYDLAGVKVAELASGYGRAGSYTTSFDGRRLASGIYFARLSYSQASVTEKLILVK